MAQGPVRVSLSLHGFEHITPNTSDQNQLTQRAAPWWRQYDQRHLDQTPLSHNVPIFSDIQISMRREETNDACTNTVRFVIQMSCKYKGYGTMCVYMDILGFWKIHAQACQIMLE